MWKRDEKLEGHGTPWHDYVSVISLVSHTYRYLMHLYLDIPQKVIKEARPVDSLLVVRLFRSLAFLALSVLGRPFVQSHKSDSHRIVVGLLGCRMTVITWLASIMMIVVIKTSCRWAYITKGRRYVCSLVT
jgi:hypothetical protein